MVAAPLSLPGNYVAKFAVRGLDERCGAGDADPHARRVTASARVRRSVMSEKSFNELQPVSFGERLANSQAFADLFRDGMALVEQTATYLDGPGREQSKKLERAPALTYATESMRLTTRLMQLASWLLLHRAVKEGEMTLIQANREKTKVKLSAADPGPDDIIERLPQQLQDLIGRSMTLQTKVCRLDNSIHAPAAERAAIGNPLVPQLNRLKAAFEQ